MQSVVGVKNELPGVMVEANMKVACKRLLEGVHRYAVNGGCRQRRLD